MDRGIDDEWMYDELMDGWMCDSSSQPASSIEPVKDDHDCMMGAPEWASCR